MARTHRCTHLPGGHQVWQQAQLDHWRFHRLPARTSSKPHSRHPHYAALSSLVPAQDFCGPLIFSRPCARGRNEMRLQFGESLTGTCEIEIETNGLFIAEFLSRAASSLVELHSQVSGSCTARNRRRRVTRRRQKLARRKI